MSPFDGSFGESDVPEIILAGLIAIGALGAVAGSGFSWFMYLLLWVAALAFLGNPAAFSSRLGLDWESQPDEVELTDDEESDPVRILRQRYARGEIGDDELDRKLDRLLASESTDRSQRPMEKEY